MRPVHRESEKGGVFTHPSKNKLSEEKENDEGIRELRKRKDDEGKSRLREKDVLSVDADVETKETVSAVALLANEDERKNLVDREESFEELPYVPTTLPLER